MKPLQATNQLFNELSSLQNLLSDPDLWKLSIHEINALLASSPLVRSRKELRPVILLDQPGEQFYFHRFFEGPSGWPMAILETDEGMLITCGTRKMKFAD